MDLYKLVVAMKLTKGGGGSETQIDPLSVTENGTYTAEEGHAYSPVSVNVPSVTPTGNINITSTAQTDVTQYATAQVVDSDLVAENIKKDVNILGVVGSYEGSGGGHDFYGDFDIAHTTMSKYTVDQIVVPDGIVTLTDNAFKGLNVKRVILPESVRVVGQYCFQNTAIQNMVFPEGVTDVNFRVFSGCSELITVELPSTITNISSYPFENCNNLSGVTIKAINPPTAGSNSFKNLSSVLKFYVPAESVEAYKAASTWSTVASRIYAIQE